MTKVIIDSSYYNFYRFYATVSWYNYSPERKEEAEGVGWIDNPTFMKTFEKMWFENIKKIIKKFDVTEQDIIFARDGRDVWRYKLYPEYKANRVDTNNNDIHSPGAVFKHINEVFHPQLQSTVLRLEQAEGDDIAAVTTQYIRTVQPETKIVIITGDHDFLQLSEPGHIELYQLKGWKKITTDDPHTSLMTKILAGDPSDNIPSIYKGCGKKTAQRLANDPDALSNALEKYGRKQYDLNCTLVDFNNIPQHIVEEIEAMLDNVI